jgi:diaminopimelate epimerase
MGLDFKNIYKYSGAGNSFLIVDLTEDHSGELGNFKIKKKEERSAFSKALCSGLMDMQADGMIFLEYAKINNEIFFLEWDFYNADGSTAEMCGNACRCVGAFVFDFKSKYEKIEILTLAGNVRVEKLSSNNQFAVQMPKIKLAPQSLLLNVDGQFVEGVFLNTGVPHFVIECKEKESIISQTELWRKIRFHQTFQPKGTNVSLYCQNPSGIIFAATYERGVEDITLACGTGAVAVGRVLAKKNKLSKIDLEMPGGKLQIDFPKGYDFPVLIGEAHQLTNLEVKGT